MEYRQLGKSGIAVSAVGLGGNTFGSYADESGTAAIIHRALDLGINFLDTAHIYNRGVSEEFVGKAIKGRRGQAIVGTKAAGQMGVHISLNADAWRPGRDLNPRPSP